ncbi:hypothetical protein [Mycolicibacterium gilvum]|uniref:Putative alanine and proline rich membrane protein n=1 Tax=Mycolicibacterium gilvum TaxID=1804 RepID=A0A378SL94_9MYCO|nr:hypothetical protein [Mycolicibacterium gilvum]MCV7057341.1 hypothetical protein [Mycolicibacterium gilvum]STZ43480.1 putative alanine and proline rich membrane protein [Mycolicibacterium gilvum]
MKAVTLAAAVLALGIAVFALIRTFDAEPDYTEAQRGDAKAAVCAAFETVRTGVATNTNVTPPGGSGDITGALAVAANARVALFDGGQYLLAKLDPATPTDLAAEVRRFANQLMDIGAAATAGVPNTDEVQAGRLQDAEAVSSAISERCA